MSLTQNPSSAFMDALASPEPLLTVELRPPRLGDDVDASMDMWMGMHATVRRLVADGTMLFLTDGAVGTREEENLHHLVTNLEADISREYVCPFLTTKHTLEYCLWYAARAVEAGSPALTILGGDKSGHARCVPHGYNLRQHLRERFPGLPLGGWANPHRDASRQVDFLTDPSFTADFYLTQLVSHHDLAPVEAFVEQCQRRGVTTPGIWGVFYYRSALRKTLERLAPFFPVPIEGLERDFNERGLSPEEVCAETILALRGLGIGKVYISNLHSEKAPRQLALIRKLVDGR